MKHAVMSDVHANPKALSAAVADARRRGCGRFLLLGDVTGYGYDVKGALDLVRENFDVVLMGNHDSACLGLEPWADRFLNPNYRLDLAHRDELGDDDMEWLGARPYIFEEPGAAFVHGDYTDPEAWRYIITVGDLLCNFFVCPKQVLFCGHSHHAEAWELDEKGGLREEFASRLSSPPERAESLWLQLREGCRYIINVGSVGYPRNDFCSTYAIYDDEARRVALRRLPLDIEAYAGDLDAKGIARPPWLAAWFERRRSGGDEAKQG